jgi:subtilisin family serine protease
MSPVSAVFTFGNQPGPSSLPKRYIIYDVDKARKLGIPILEENNELGFAISYTPPPPSIKYEEDRIVRALFIPNDRYFSNQWYLRNIDAHRAWDFVTGDREIVIAVIDTGVSLSHEDLQGSVWINKDEIPFNGIDDDNNGYIDDYRGYDFVNNDPTPGDDNGHGTHVAGIIAAKMNNNNGIAGIAQVKIMPLKVLDSYGNGYDSDVAEAIYYAVENGARIISMSIGGSDYSTVLKEACDYAWNHGVLLVAASGNDGENNIDYPAAFSSVIAVGSVDKKDKLSSFSDFGKQQELVAPGESIYSTYLGNSYTYFSGTSMATPQVSALASLILSMNPSISGSDLRNLLHISVDDLGPKGKDQYYGYGRINVSKAVSLVPLRSSTSITSQNFSGSLQISSPRTNQGVVLSVSWDGDGVVEIINSLGEVLWSKQLNGSGVRQFVFNYPSGGYFTVIRTSNDSRAEKLFWISESSANFTVTNVSVEPHTVLAGTNITASICVHNSRDDGVFTAGLIINGTVFDLQTAAIESNQTVCLKFNYTPVNAGLLEVSLNGFYDFYIQVLQPPVFNVTYNVYPLRLNPGESVNVTACVSNEGSIGANFTFALQVDNVEVENRTVFVNSGEKLCTVFNYTLFDPGTHHVGIVFDNLEPVTVVVGYQGDVTGDGNINFDDLISILNLVLSKEYDSLADLDSDGDVDFSDIVSVLNLIISG